jgi:hypothetical protein
MEDRFRADVAARARYIRGVRLLALLVIACVAPVATAQPIPHGRRARSGTEAEIHFCVEETNRYRKLAKKPPLQRSTLLEEFARAGAKHDHQKRAPHDHFNHTKFPGSFSNLAENQIPRWHLDAEGSVRTVIRAGIAAMWAEGPGGGHYENIVGKFSELGCGIYIEGEEMTVVQDFREP